MRTAARTAILLTLPAIVFHGRDATASDVVTVSQSIRVHDATPPQIALVRWAVGRFDDAHLELPPLDIYFHHDRSGCRGIFAFYAGDRIDMCPGLILNLLPRHFVLHEMAHAWSVHSMTQVERAAFMRLRGLSTWNSDDQPWSDRGFEQAADIIAWAIGDGILSPTIPDNDETTLVTDYEFLTGSLPPGLLHSVPEVADPQVLAHPGLSGQAGRDVIATKLRALGLTKSAGDWYATAAFQIRVQGTAAYRDLYGW
jgi:hypothetical protein